MADPSIVTYSPVASSESQLGRVASVLWCSVAYLVNGIAAMFMQ
jgi:hypothetical protein